MSILNIQPIQIGLVGVRPGLWCLTTNNTVGEVLATGYLTKVYSEGYSFKDGDLAAVITAATPSSADVSSGWYQINNNAGVWSLTTGTGPGNVVLPTIANHLAVYTNVTGGLGEDAATAINGGNIQAGVSGTAGTLTSFPGTAAKGSLIVQAVANTGNTTVTLQNALHGQASTYTIPDSGLTNANVIVSGKTGGQTITVGGLQATTGSFIAGSSGNAGTYTSFPGASNQGSLIFSATNNVGGNFTTTVTNAGSVGQNQVVSVPNSGAATANFLLSALTGAGIQHITSGSLEVDAGSLLSGIGTGGFVGLVKAFPTTANSGFVAIQAAINGSGNFGTTISNATTQAQAQVVSIPDAGAATANFAIAAAPLVNGNLIQANGTGGRIADAGIPASSLVTFGWSTIAGTSQNAAVQNGYIIGNAALTTVLLPATAAIGQRVSIRGLGASGWVLTANSGQTIKISPSTTSTAGSLASTNLYDTVDVECIVANLTWAVVSQQSSGLTVT